MNSTGFNVNFNTSLNTLFTNIKTNANDIDLNSEFPIQEFKWLHENGLLAINLSGNKLDFKYAYWTGLLELLKNIGASSITVGRIYEGHINALLLIHLFGNEWQQENWFSMALNGNIFSVWNTQGNDGLIILPKGNGKYLLQGCKTFCSGANWINQPIITGQLIGIDEKGWQMFVLPSNKMNEVTIDKSFWDPIGVKGSVSYKLDFTGIEIEKEDFLGIPDSYYKEPHFSGGAIRFVAIQLGAAESIFKETVKLLKAFGRENDPFQKARIAEMAWLIETGNIWLKSAGKKINQWEIDGETGSIVNYVGMARCVMEDICKKIMQLSEKCTGSRGLMKPNILERLHRDLIIYLRQPGPDATILKIGEFVFSQAVKNDE